MVVHTHVPMVVLLKGIKIQDFFFTVTWIWFVKVLSRCIIDSENTLLQDLKSNNYEFLGRINKFFAYFVFFSCRIIFWNVLNAHSESPRRYCFLPKSLLFTSFEESLAKLFLERSSKQKKLKKTFLILLNITSVACMRNSACNGLIFLLVYYI